MSDFKLEVGMFVREIDNVRDITNEISVITKVDKNKIHFYNFDNKVQSYTYEINKFSYEVSNTYDFKEIIYSNIKKELLTEEEKEIVDKWVDAVGREEVESIEFRGRGKTSISVYTGKDCGYSIDYTGKFKNVELGKAYTLEELGL